MVTFDATFGKMSHIFLPVIHVETEDQAVRNAKIARDAGADGVFLINHRISWGQLLNVYEWLRGSFPTLWIGVNCLDLDRATALQHAPKGLQGLWSDDGGISDHGVSRDFFNFEDIRKGRGWRGLYFGGVAFKGQAVVGNVALAAKQAMSYIDVITTSGPATGVPPPVAQIKSMKQAISGHPLAIASGMTSENVEKYMPYCDCFLVSTGISSSFTELEPTRTRTFARKLGK